VIAVQEIRDSAGTAFPKLVALLNGQVSGRTYSSVVGPREGRTSSKEQYAFIYEGAKVTPLRNYRYPDSGGVYERPPFAVEFQLARSTSKFVLVNIHSKPDDAVAEVSALATVYDSVNSNFGNANVLTLGDYNCGCSYVTSSEYAKIKFYTETRFKWLIPNTADTMVSSDCPYDRLVVAGSWLTGALDAKTATPFDFEAAYSLSHATALTVSDHLPVTVDLLYSATAAGMEVLPSPSSSSSSSSTSTTALIAGVCVGVAVAVMLFVVFMYYARCRSRLSYASIETGPLSVDLRTIQLQTLPLPAQPLA